MNLTEVLEMCGGFSIKNCNIERAYIEVLIKNEQLRGSSNSKAAKAKVDLEIPERLSKLKKPIRWAIPIN